MAQTRSSSQVASTVFVLWAALLCLAAGPDQVGGDIVEDSFTAKRQPNRRLVDAIGCWRRMVRVDTTGVRDSAAARSAIDRFLATDNGLGVVNELCGLSAQRDESGAGWTIEVSFEDELPVCRDGADGCFSPAVAHAEHYQVAVRTQYLDAASDPTVFVFGEYPGNPECSVVFFYQQAASAMAHTLYHELLHIWFMNAFSDEDRAYPTGHGLVNRCEFEEEFLERLRAQAAELAVLEGRQPKQLLRADQRQR